MKNNIIDLLIKVRAIIKDSHFVGTSGKHMPVYINKDALLPKTKYTSQVGVMMAEKFKNKKIEVVV
ncbi:MAG: orotate phosphoribosyltransferase, partial [Candidatus Staskawiczbacteria bacterium]|nr:orotate phosphoribosyltransferase [Candidatus Staskawiczbacteria bacterium]